jgi:HSP20 family protein
MTEFLKKIAYIPIYLVNAEQQPGDNEMFARLNNFEHSLTQEFRDLEFEMDRLLEAAGVRGIVSSARSVDRPPLNIGVTPDQVDIYVFIAGIDPKTVDISLERNQLSIDGKRPAERSNNVNTLKKERFEGDFHHLVTLPDDIDADRVEANYHNGVLHVVVNRREAPKPRQITVQSQN